MQFPHVKPLGQGVWYRHLSTRSIGKIVSSTSLALVVTACGVAGEVSGDGTLEGSAPNSPAQGGKGNSGTTDNAGGGGNGNGTGNGTTPDDPNVSPNDPNVSPGTGGSGNSSVSPTSPGTGTSDAPTQTPVTFACDESARPPVATLRRLTMTEYSNTVKDLAVWATGNENIVRSVQTILESLPQDQREPVPQDVKGSYRRLDQTLQQAHVDNLYGIGAQVGQLLTQGVNLDTVVGSCATDNDNSNDSACLDNFIRTFGSRALRRPINADDVAFFRSVYGDSTRADRAAYADVIQVMLNVPDFIYFVEHGANSVSGQPGVYELSPVELASRLSYQLWQTAPDDELLAVAIDGSLAQPAVYEAQVDRLLADPRAKRAASEFIEDWLKVEELPSLDSNNNDPIFRAFAGDIKPSPELRQAMIDDVVDLVNHYLWTEPAGLDALFTSELSFARDETLASIYGVEPWDGVSEPPALPPGERPGVFTRALFLSTGTANTRPIMKGVFLRRRILCDSIPSPPAGAASQLPEFRENMTTRELVEEITQVPGSNCASCHTNFINPLGFATEGFDSLGRVRSEQALFDETGNFVEAKPVNTQVTPRVDLADDTAISTPAELMALMAESDKVESCFARNYFRFTFARWEDDSLDGCALESVRQELADGGTLADALKAMVLNPTFKRRAFE